MTYERGIKGLGDHASLDGVCERLATCAEGPSPKGWTQGAIAVGRDDVCKVLAVIDTLRAERDEARAAERERDAQGRDHESCHDRGTCSACRGAARAGG